MTEVIAPVKKRPVWHYVPLPRFLTDDAIKHGRRLAEVLGPYIARVRPEHANCESIATDDEVHRTVVQSLATSPAWEGYKVAFELKTRGWPVDADLVRIIHRWSCNLKRDEIAAWSARKAAKKKSRRR